MNMFAFLSNFTGGTVSSEILLSIAIIVCAIFIEDVTTVIVGVLAADGILPVPIAFVSLYIGIIIGDTALYSLGWFSRIHPRLAHYIEHDLTAPFRSWLENNYSFKSLLGPLRAGIPLHYICGERFLPLPSLKIHTDGTGWRSALG